jgi:hypothetical protein
MRQPGVRYVLSSTVPSYSYSSRLTDSCTVLDPLGAQAICKPGHLSGRGGEDVLGESTSYIFQFYLFPDLFTILILSCTQEHFCLAEGVSLETANIVFDKAS